MDVSGVPQTTAKNNFMDVLENVGKLMRVWLDKGQVVVSHMILSHNNKTGLVVFATFSNLSMCTYFFFF